MVLCSPSSAPWSAVSVRAVFLVRCRSAECSQILCNFCAIGLSGKMRAHHAAESTKPADSPGCGAPQPGSLFIARCAYGGHSPQSATRVIERQVDHARRQGRRSHRSRIRHRSGRGASRRCQPSSGCTRRRSRFRRGREHSSLDGLQTTADTPTSSLKPPLLREVRVRSPPRALLDESQ